MQYFFPLVAQILAPLLRVDQPAIAATLTTPPDPSLGDVAFPCFHLAATLRRTPAAIAADLAAKLELVSPLASVSAAGPYLNFKFDRPAAAAKLIGEILERGDTWGESAQGRGQTVCIDFCSPNIAKRMHLGHLRSTVIGQALVRLHQALGYRVVRINFLGDWGTQFGKLVVAWQRWGDPAALEQDPIAELQRIYVRFHQAAEQDPGLEAEGRRAFRRLEEGDTQLLALWQFIRAATVDSMLRTLAVLDVAFDDYTGESAYQQRTEVVVRQLTDMGLLVESEGALVVELAGLPPCLIIKTDGATLYQTRDIAAALHRQELYQPARSLYVVDMGQSLHFRQVFGVLERMGLEWAHHLQHVGFGVMRAGGKRLRTRAGDAVYLDDVLEQAIAAAREELEARSPGMEGLAEAARAIGAGAVVFNDLKHQRQKDIDFNPDEAIRFDGETGPYVQYAHARSQNVLKKAGASVGALALSAHEALEGDAEWALISAMAEFPAAVAAAADRSEPHVAARSLLDVAKAFNRFYHDAPVLRAESGARSARLALVAAAGLTLRKGLWVLGLEAPPMRGD